MNNSTIQWFNFFNGLDVKLRKAFQKHSLASAIPHLDRDLEWLFERTNGNEYAKMEVDRIKAHIIGLVGREKQLSIFRYASYLQLKKNKLDLQAAQEVIRRHYT